MKKIPLPNRGRGQGEGETFRHPRIKSFHAIDVCESTQTLAKQQAEQGAPDGTLILAHEQTQGQGQHGRHWHSPKGGLWWSLLLRPNLSPKNLTDLSPVTSLGILQGIERVTGAPCQLKWPNDILLKGKKLGGVISESSLKGSTLEWIIIGIGINVNNPLTPELQKTAITLSQWSGREIALEPFLKTVLDEFFKVYGLFLKEGFTPIKPLYTEKLQDRTTTRVQNGRGIKI